VTRIVLASGSPRRNVLLGLLLDDFDVVVPDVDETLPPGDIPAAMEEVALRKADAVQRPDAVVVAADTAIVVDGAVLGKPMDRSDADRMIRSLNGREHLVVTAVAVLGPSGHARFHVRTTVRLDLTRDAMTAYLEAGAWQGKAGGYGVQDPLLADHVTMDGPWSNVVGLPLHAVHQALMDQGIPCHHPPEEAALRAQNPF